MPSIVFPKTDIELEKALNQMQQMNAPKEAMIKLVKEYDTKKLATPSTKQSFKSGASGTWEAPKTPKEMLTAEDFKREMFPAPTVPFAERLKTSATSGLDTAKEAFAVGTRGVEQSLSTFDTDKTATQKTGDVLMGTGKVIGGTLGTVIGSGISSIFGFAQPEIEKVVNAGAETAKSIAKQGALSQGLSESQAEKIAQETFNENAQKVLTKVQKAKDDFVKLIGNEQQANDLLKSGEYILDSIGLEVVKAPVSRISKEVTQEFPKVAEAVKGTAVKLGEDVVQAGKVIGEDLSKVPNKIGESIEQTAKEVYREQAKDIVIPKLDELTKKERGKVDITPTRNREIVIDSFKQEQIDEVTRMLEEGKLKSSDKVIQRGEIGKEIGSLAEELRYNLSSYNDTLKLKDEILSEASDMAYKLADDTAISIISGGNPEKFVNDFLKELKKIMADVAPNVDRVNPNQLLTVRQKLDDFVERLKGTTVYDKKKTVGQDLETAFSKANKEFRDFVNNQVKKLAPNAETSELLRRQMSLYRVSDNLSSQISKEPAKYLPRKIKEIRDYIGVSPYEFWTLMGGSSIAGIAAGSAFGLSAGLALPTIGAGYLAKNAIGKVIRVNDMRAGLGRILKNINKKIEKAPVSKRADLKIAKQEVENLLNLPKKVLDKAKVSFKIQNEKEAREVMKLIKQQEIEKTKRGKAIKKLEESSKTKPVLASAIPLERPRGQGVIALNADKLKVSKETKKLLDDLKERVNQNFRNKDKELLINQKKAVDFLNQFSPVTKNDIKMIELVKNKKELIETVNFLQKIKKEGYTIGKGFIVKKGEFDRLNHDSALVKEFRKKSKSMDMTIEDAEFNRDVFDYMGLKSLSKKANDYIETIENILKKDAEDYLKNEYNPLKEEAKRLGNRLVLIKELDGKDLPSAIKILEKRKEKPLLFYELKKLDERVQEFAENNPQYSDMSTDEFFTLATEEATRKRRVDKNTGQNLRKKKTVNVPKQLVEDIKSGKEITNYKGDKKELEKIKEAVKKQEFIVSEKDIDFEKARNAYYWTSFNPERRAKSTIDEYVENMKEFSENIFKKVGKSPEVIEDLNRFKEGYLKRLNDLLSAESKTASSMVTGPAKFNTAKNQSKMNIADSYRDELLDFYNKAEDKILKKNNYYERGTADNPIKLSDKTAIEDLQNKIDKLEKYKEKMTKANKILRNDKISLDERYEKLKNELGFSEETIDKMKEMKLRGYYQDFNISSTTTKIRETKKRLERANKLQNTPTRKIKTDSADIIDNTELNRVQIAFKEIPNEETRKTLKSNGFRWSPKNKTWQAFRNVRSLKKAKEIVDKLNF